MWTHQRRQPTHSVLRAKRSSIPEFNAKQCANQASRAAIESPATWGNVRCDTAPALDADTHRKMPWKTGPRTRQTHVRSPSNDNAQRVTSILERYELALRRIPLPRRTEDVGRELRRGRNDLDIDEETAFGTSLRRRRKQQHFSHRTLPRNDRFRLRQMPWRAAGPRALRGETLIASGGRFEISGQLVVRRQPFVPPIPRRRGMSRGASAKPPILQQKVIAIGPSIRGAEQSQYERADANPTLLSARRTVHAIRQEGTHASTRKRRAKRASSARSIDPGQKSSNRFFLIGIPSRGG